MYNFLMQSGTESDWLKSWFSCISCLKYAFSSLVCVGHCKHGRYESLFLSRGQGKCACDKITTCLFTFQLQMNKEKKCHKLVTKCHGFVIKLWVLVYKDSFFPNPPSRHFGDSLIHSSLCTAGRKWCYRESISIK